jgi:hypothetical protein
MPLYEVTAFKTVRKSTAFSISIFVVPFDCLRPSFSKILVGTTAGEEIKFNLVRPILRLR